MIDLRYGRDCLESLREMADCSVHCCVTSPPYWGLRDYGCEGQIGLEPTPDAYVSRMVEVFREVRRVLRDDGTLWLNVGDSTRDKQQQLIPWRLALALQQPWFKCKGCEAVAHQSQWGHWPNGRLICSSCEKSKGHDVDTPGWWCRSVICWAKKSCMPESVTDRPTNSWEPIFLLAKSAKYFYDAEAVREPHEHGIKSEGEGGEYYGGKHGKGTGRSAENGNVWNPKVRNYNPAGRNQRNVWHLGPEPYAAAHFATFPSEIPRRAILAGTSARGCCPNCLAPWVRVKESSGGWKPSCTCPPHDTIACRVLDPFSGSATTGQVAFSLGRDYIGLDLSTEYLELARERCGGLFCK